MTSADPTQDASPSASALFERSRRPLVVEGMLGQAMASLVGGAFLAAYALALGASQLQVGLLAALPAAGQLLQVPAVYLIRAVGRRKPVALAAAAGSRSVWLAAAAIPLLLDGTAALGLLFVLVFLAAGVGSMGGVAWLSWMRDLVPEETMGRFFSHRMLLATLLAMGVSIGGGFFVDWWIAGGRVPALAYSVAFALGAVLGLGGIVFLARADEPAPPPQPPGGGSVLTQLLAPFSDDNFRRLLVFSAAWTWTLTFAAPFFIVFMLERVGLAMSRVILLTVVSQAFIVLFLGFWGRIADRFSNRSVLGAAGTILLLAILGWTFVTMPEPHRLTMPLLVVIHALMGIAMGGITLATGNIGLKLSPPGRAETYVTSLGVLNSAVAFVSPLCAGLMAAFFSDRSLSLTLELSDAARTVEIPTVSLRGLDFLFVLTFLLGLYAMHRLAFVQEEGTVDERVVLEELREEILDGIVAVASFATLRQVVWFPGSRLLRNRTRTDREGSGS